MCFHVLVHAGPWHPVKGGQYDVAVQAPSHALHLPCTAKDFILDHVFSSLSMSLKKPLTSTAFWFDFVQLQTIDSEKWNRW